MGFFLKNRKSALNLFTLLEYCMYVTMFLSSWFLFNQVVYCSLELNPPTISLSHYPKYKFSELGYTKVGWLTQNYC